MARQDDDLLLEDEIDETFFDEAPATQKSGGNSAAPVTLDSEEDGDVEVPGQLAVDIYETPDKLVIKSRVAGVNAKDLDIQIDNGMLTIQGTLSAGEDAAATQWHLQECYWGEFKRTINLPVKVNEDEVEAVLKDGVLTVGFTKIQPPIKKVSVVQK
ncbi:MAG: Hsp20/alpha crystallin family protein [Candidatus Nomurabacteria bacterium]|jgi:HSP20 family protein|nr:Hsp20/alpha crystallin family protein [Candidatus Nomurabacteria bacterium]